MLARLVAQTRPRALQGAGRRPWGCTHRSRSRPCGTGGSSAPRPGPGTRTMGFEPAAGWGGGQQGHIRERRGTLGSPQTLGAGGSPCPTLASRAASPSPRFLTGSPGRSAAARRHRRRRGCVPAARRQPGCGAAPRAGQAAGAGGRCRAGRPARRGAARGRGWAAVPPRATAPCGCTARPAVPFSIQDIRTRSPKRSWILVLPPTLSPRPVSSLQPPSPAGPGSSSAPRSTSSAGSRPGERGCRPQALAGHPHSCCCHPPAASPTLWGRGPPP